MTSTTQPPPSPTAFRQLPSLSSLSRLCSPPSNETLPIYNHAKMSYPPVHTFPSCAQMASSQPAPLQHHHLSPPQPPSMPASKQSPSSITTLLHACSAASHEMLNSPPAAPELVRVKAEPLEDASSLSRRSSVADSLYSGNASDSRSLNASTLGSSYSYVAGESAWPGGSLSPSTNGAGLALGSASNSKLQKEDMEDRKMVKSTSPDSVGSGEGSVCSGKTLKQTKRAAQNREAQRAFRSRKEQYIKELEHTSTLYTALQATHSSLTSRLISLESTLTMVESDRRRVEAERASHDAERCLWERERAGFAAERASWARERAEWMAERRELEAMRREVNRSSDAEARDSERERARDALRKELDADAAAPLPTPEVEVEELVISPGVRAAQEAELARERKRARLS